jgi:hypothetical protein
LRTSRLRWRPMRESNSFSGIPNDFKSIFAMLATR